MHAWPWLPSGGDEGDRLQNELLQSCDTVVMGRRTYDVFAAVWPTRSGDAYSDRINREGSRADFDLVGSRPFGNGVVPLTYRKK